MAKKNEQLAFEDVENVLLKSTRDEATDLVADLRKKSVNGRGEINLPLYEIYLQAMEVYNNLFPQEQQ